MRSIFQIIDGVNESQALEELGEMLTHNNSSVSLTQRYWKRRSLNGEGYTPALLLYNQQGKATQSDPLGMTPFHYALSRKKYAIARFLLLKEPTVLIMSNQQGDLPFHELARAAKITRAEFFADRDIIAILEALLKSPCDLTNLQGQLPLHVVLYYDKIALDEFRSWTCLSPDLTQGDEDGWATIHHAIKTHNNTVVSYMLSQSRKHLWLKTDDGKLPQHIAVTENNIIGLRLCAEQGAALQAGDHLGNTPIHYAAENGFDRALLFLINRGGMNNQHNNAGYTPLHLVIKHFDKLNQSPVFLFDDLFKQGADPFVKTTDNEALNAHELARRCLSPDVYAEFKKAFERYNCHGVFTPDMLRYHLKQNTSPEMFNELLGALNALFQHPESAREQYDAIMLEALKLRATQVLPIEQLGEFSDLLKSVTRKPLAHEVFEETEHPKTLETTMTLEADLALCDRTTRRSPASPRL